MRASPEIVTSGPRSKPAKTPGPRARPRPQRQGARRLALEARPLTSLPRWPRRLAAAWPS